MLDIKFIREHPEKVKEGLKNKGFDFDVQGLIALDEERREKIKEVENLRAVQNITSEEIAALSGKDREEKILESKELKHAIGNAAEGLRSIEKDFQEFMYRIPNVPLDDVPVGKGEADNKVLREWGKIPEFDFIPKDHMALGKYLGIIDNETAAKVAGARFTYLKGSLVRLQLALMQFAFDVLGSEKELAKAARSIEETYPTNPFVPVVVPQMIKPDVYIKTARLSEDVKDEHYRLAQDDLYLIGSGEHTLVPMHEDEIIDEGRLPLRYVTFSTCFRREAGSYGKDTHGILRLHQFDKVEMESFTASDMAFKEHTFFISLQEHIMRMLKLPYRVVISSTGDMDGPCAHHVDIETWMPGQNTYRETHSADFTTDYQTRRLNTRVKRKDGSVEFAFANDATVIAIGRTLVAILENYQKKDGSVDIPEVLQPYMRGIANIQPNG